MSYNIYTNYVSDVYFKPHEAISLTNYTLLTNFHSYAVAPAVYGILLLYIIYILLYNSRYILLSFHAITTSRPRCKSILNALARYRRRRRTSKISLSLRIFSLIINIVGGLWVFGHPRGFDT